MYRRLGICGMGIPYTDMEEEEGDQDHRENQGVTQLSLKLLLHLQ